MHAVLLLLLLLAWAAAGRQTASLLPSKGADSASCMLRRAAACPAVDLQKSTFKSVC
jgi:hypothetical protein